jgi:hypothetical protein
MGGGNEDQEEIYCPTIGLTVVLTEREWGKCRSRGEMLPNHWFSSGVNGARGWKRE